MENLEERAKKFTFDKVLEIEYSEDYYEHCQVPQMDVKDFVELIEGFHKQEVEKMLPEGEEIEAFADEFSLKAVFDRRESYLGFICGTKWLKSKIQDSLK